MPRRFLSRPSFARAGALALCLGAPLLASVAAAGPGQTGLVAHRAMYDLALDPNRSKSGVSDVKGRMVYEFLGSACTGYSMNMRFVSQVSDSDGKVVTTDLRAETWENADGSAFNFNSTQYVDSRLNEATLGAADRSGDRGIEVDLKKPGQKKFSLSRETLFPTQHLAALIEAARQGKRLLAKRVFDGSENGEKVYDTTAAIGQPSTGAKPGQAVAAKTKELAAQPNWPVSIAYFELDGGGEQVPSYQLSFDLYANGFSDGLRLDYGEFVLVGTLRQLEFIDEKPCN